MSRAKFFRSLAVILICIASGPLNAGIIYDENNDGNFSRDKNDPTQLGTLPVGVSSILAVIELARTFGDVDIFTFDIAPGTKLSEVRIPSYSSSDHIAVMGVNNANFFPFDPSTFNNTLTLTDLQQIIGVAQFGDESGMGWFNTTNGAGAQDLLTSANPLITTANMIGARVSGTKSFTNLVNPFIGPQLLGPTDKFDELGEGTYTFYMQQTGANTEYQLDLTVVALPAIPEPTSLLLAGVFGTLVYARRRRA